MRRLALVALLIAVGCVPDSGVAPATAPNAGDPLPPSGFLGSWQRAGEPLVLDGANLYGRINGGAEVFLELGFESLSVQAYASGEHEVEAELYTMSDPLAALGIYLMKCGREAPAEGLEARHTAGRYQVQMVQGPFYLVVNSMAASEEARLALVEVARYVAGSTEGAVGLDPWANLPESGRVAGSERVIRGQFTLERVFTLGQGDMLQLEGTATAVSASYDDGEAGSHTLVVVEYPDEEQATQVLTHVADNLDTYLTTLRREPDRLVFQDFEELFGEVRVEGRRLTVKARLATSPELG